MNRFIIVLTCLTFIVGGLTDMQAQNHQSIAMNGRIDLSDKVYSPSSSLKDGISLESIFSPDSVPQLNITVLENALGDIIQDDVLNIRDLLRLRDIIIGRPPAQSGYELAEGDFTRDGSINLDDLNFLRDILLRKIGVPYLINSAGGEVLGDGIRLTIPPGAVDTAILISIRRTSESEFARDMGVDTKGAVEDSAYFMAAFEINSTVPDFKLPVNATIKLDSIPPCAYEGLNGLFAVVPDRDGDGHTEVFLFNELQLDGDSLTITTKDIPVPTIQTVSHSQVEPGISIIISGTGFGNDQRNILVKFINEMYPDSFRYVNPTLTEDNIITVSVPDVSPGQYQLLVENISTGLISNSSPIEILPLSPVIGDIRAIIVGFYVNLAARMDLLDADSLFYAVEDTSVRNFLLELRQNGRSFLDTSILFFNDLPDSQINEFASLASYIQNITSGGVYANSVTLSTTLQCLPQCIGHLDDYSIAEMHLKSLKKQFWDLFKKCLIDRVKTGDCRFCEQAEKVGKEILDITDYMADALAEYDKCKCAKCKEYCDGCKNANFIGWGPKSKKVSGGYGPGGFGTNGCCINIIRYKSNQCTQPVVRVPLGEDKEPVPPSAWQYLDCDNSSNKSGFSLSNLNYALLDTRPHSGSVVKITNAPVPYNIVGILNDNGKAFIPQAPMNTKVTFSMYDPVTGLYDPDVGTYTTGSTPGGFDRPLLLFRPNTSIRNFAIKIGDLVHDSITQDMQRIDYSLNIGAADTSKLLNIGFSAATRLSFHIEDPDDIILFDNMDLSCYMNSHVRFNKIGRYYIRVALGVSAQSGQFDLGITEAPSRPLPSSCLCGDIVVDTLYEELSPYEVSCPATIVTGDTIVSEAGVILEFDNGGIINANGALIGTGSPMKPITLKQLQADKRKSLSIGDKIKNGTQRRKEVEP
jgi:hypothetical protein